MIKNNLLKKILDIGNIFIIIAYSIVLVVFVNNPTKTYIENYFGYFVLGIFILQSVFIYKRIYFPKIYFGFLCFLILSAASIITNYHDSSYKLFISLIQIFIFSIIIYNMLIYNSSSFPLEIGLVSGLMYSIFVGYFIGRDFFTGSILQRYSGTLENPNHYSFMLTVALLFLIRRFLFYRDKGRFNQVINSFIIILILIFSYEVVFFAISRQGVLLVFLLLGFLFLEVFKNSKFSGKITLVLTTLIIVFYTWYNVQNMPLVYNRIGSLFSWLGGTSDFEVDNSIYYRFAYMIDAYNLWLEKPLFGHGLHQFKYVNQSGVSHNNFFEILVNNGIIGFISYYSLYVYILYSFFKIKLYNKVDSNWMLVVLIMLFIADMTILTYIEKPNWLIFSVVLFIISKYDKNNSFIFRL